MGYSRTGRQRATSPLGPASGSWGKAAWHLCHLAPGLGGPLLRGPGAGCRARRRPSLSSASFAWRLRTGQVLFGLGELLSSSVPCSPSCAAGAGPPSRCQNRAYSSCSPPRPFLEALRHWLRSAISDFFSFLLRQCGASLSSLEVANRPPTHVARGRQSRQMVDSPMGAGSSLLASLACSPDPCGRGGPGEEGESGPAPPLAALGRAPLRRCPWGSPSRALPQVRGLSVCCLVLFEEGAVWTWPCGFCQCPWPACHPLPAAWRTAACSGVHWAGTEARGALAASFSVCGGLRWASGQRFCLKTP